MSFPAYPTYKDSGVEWLGEVPTHWSVHRITELYREVAELGQDELPILSVSIHDGVSDDEAEPDGEGRKVNRSADRSKYKQVRPNDLVYNMMRAWQGGFGSVKVLGMVSPAYVVARPRDDVPSGLVELMLRTAGAIEEMRRRSKGVTDFRLRMYWDEFKDMRIALPPAREQLDILNFLGREMAKIDALVEQQRRLIALLKEKRQAVISLAVTKGLNPNAPMKDSGVDWLGEVPAHWLVTRLKHISSAYCDGPFGSSLKSEHYVDAGARVIRLQNIKSHGFDGTDAAYIDIEYFKRALTGHEVVEGDVLIAGLGDEINLVGRACVAPNEIGPAIVKADCFRFRLYPEHLSSFVSAQLTAGAAYAAGLLSSGSTRSRIPAGTMAQRVIVVPSYDEQVSIFRWIKEATSRFDNLLAEASVANDLLRERRAALISAAVTGKIDVRGSAKVLPFPIDRARARRLIAAEVIDRSAHQATFGRTKLQKLLYLAEAHANVNELAGRYVRMHYGPLDQDMIDEIEGAAVDMGFDVVDPGYRKMVRYRPVAARGRNRGELAEWLGDERLAKLDKLITDFADLDTHAAEAVATLYAVWNDALIDGETLSDDWIVNGFLTAWNRTKAENFSRHELPHWLDWMRRHGLVPTGAGPKTSIGGLFA